MFIKRQGMNIEASLLITRCQTQAMWRVVKHFPFGLLQPSSYMLSRLQACITVHENKTWSQHTTIYFDFFNASQSVSELLHSMISNKTSVTTVATIFLTEEVCWYLFFGGGASIAPFHWFNFSLRLCMKLSVITHNSFAKKSITFSVVTHKKV